MEVARTRLSITERRKIERWRYAKVPVDEMARVLKRCRSTIFRELQRNHFTDPEMPQIVGYFGAAAQLMTADRRARQRKLIKYPNLCEHVVARLKNGWTPEQIANRMIYEHAPSRVCQETIYRYIYSKEGLKQELWWYLPTHRMARKPRRARKRLPPKFHRDVSILFRPDVVARRTQFGHGLLGDASITCQLTGRRFDAVQTEAWTKQRYFAGGACQPVHRPAQEPKQEDEASDGQDH